MDRESFIEAFGLTRVTGQPIDLKDLQRRLEANPNAFTRASLLQQILGDLKKVGDYPKKIQKKLPLDKLKSYFVKTIYGVHKVVGKDGSDEVSGEMYIIARDV